MNSASLSIPEEVKVICETFREAGFKSHVVGGCVRDLLLGREPKDWDITTNANPDQIQSLFEETFYENDYGTVGIVTKSEDFRLKIIEATPYRLESEYSNARHPDSVRFGTELTEDLKRRDFTINAIAYDPISRETVDLYGGREDLGKKLLRTVGNPADRFHEDALRMLRALRIAAELDFALESATAAGIAENATTLEKVSRERIRDEFIRILLSPRPLQALYMAQKLGILQYIIPELESAVGIGQNQAHSYDVFEHLLRSMQHAADKKWSFEVRLAALLHDIGKPATREWSEAKGDWTFYNHEVVGAKMAKFILKNLRFSRETIDLVSDLIRWHMFFSDPDTVTLSAVRRIIVSVGKEHINELLELRMCDRIGTGRPKEQPFRLRKYMSMVEEALRDPITVGMLKIDGRRILELSAEKPGPRLGWTLHALLEEILDDPSKNTTEYLEKRSLELLSFPSGELELLGKAGKDRKAAAEGEAVQELRTKYHVS